MAKNRVCTFSGGMKRRLSVAMCFLGDPRIVFLGKFDRDVCRVQYIPIIHIHILLVLGGYLTLWIFMNNDGCIHVSCLFYCL